VQDAVPGTDARGGHPSAFPPGLSDLDWDEPRSLGVGALARAFHAREDLERLAGLLRRFLGASREVAALREIGIESVERMLAASEAEIDLARGALLIAREDDPRLDMGRTLEKVDRLAAQLAARLAEVGSNPLDRLAAANDFIFDEKGFKTEAAPDPGRRLVDLHLDRVLARRRGHCLGLSVLYLALGARAGLPLFGVALPGHFFVRFDDGRGTRVNIETTLRGAVFDDRYYVERYGLQASHVDSGLYLGNLARREVLVQVLNNRANCYWDLGDAARAARDLERVAGASRSFAPGFAGQGFLALQRGELPQALANLRKAIEIDPTYARAHLHLGDALLRAGQVEKALEAVNRAIELEPGSALAHTNLGRVEARRGDLPAAMAAHLRAIELDPRCHIAWNNLGVARRTAGDVRGARDAFKRALGIAPRFMAALENLALVERSAGHRVRGAMAVRAVLAAYERKIARSPDDAGLHAALARFLVEVRGDIDAALGHAERACALAPDSPRAWEALALVVRRQGNAARAVKLLERALALAPSKAGAEQPRLKSLLESTRLLRDSSGEKG
jgi:tetratricopeptide (TPR) repeat protein